MAAVTALGISFRRIRFHSRSSRISSRLDAVRKSAWMTNYVKTLGGVYHTRRGLTYTETVGSQR